MSERCSICGKRAGFGAILKCNVCGQNICHRHENEQFIRYDIPTLDEFLNWDISYNYPTGKAMNKHSFKCYMCRTGKIPKDMGKTKLDTFDYFKIFIWLSIIIIIILSILYLYGNLLGLSSESSEILKYLCITYIVIAIIFFISLMIYWSRKYKIK